MRYPTFKTGGKYWDKNAIFLKLSDDILLQLKLFSKIILWHLKTAGLNGRTVAVDFVQNCYFYCKCQGQRKWNAMKCHEILQSLFDRINKFIVSVSHTFEPFFGAGHFRFEKEGASEGISTQIDDVNTFFVFQSKVTDWNSRGPVLIYFIYRPCS